MTEKDRFLQDFALWRRAKAEWGRTAADTAPAALDLAGYLDGRLDETAAARIEAWIVTTPEAIDLLIAARAELGSEAGEAPVAAVERARALVGFKPASETGELRAWLAALVPAGWQPAQFAAALAAVLLLGVGAFELGREGATVLAAPAEFPSEFRVADSEAAGLPWSDEDVL